MGWTGGAFIRRPISMGGLRRTSAGVEIDVLYRAIGLGTRWLARVQAGETVSVLGPLGHPFQLPQAGQTQAILVGGGIGLPPLVWLAEALKTAGVPAVAFCGARTADLLPLTVDAGCSGDEPSLFCREFGRSATPGIVTTDDGSLGAKGLLPDVLAAWLDRDPQRAAGAVVYTCGPDRMMRAVAEVCRQRGMACQVCLERMMACGMGTCQSCVVRIRDAAAPDGWRYRLCCTDGPVFDATQVVWG
jgi:dihydroorotate dehydrogenase electron transfer subunit